MIDKLFPVLVWLLIAAAIWLWIKLIILAALLIVVWQEGYNMIQWCDVRDRVELQKCIDNNDLETIVAFVNHAAASCYEDGVHDGYNEFLNDHDL